MDANGAGSEHQKEEREPEAASWLLVAKAAKFFCGAPRVYTVLCARALSLCAVQSKSILLCLTDLCAASRPLQLLQALQGHTDEVTCVCASASSSSSSPNVNLKSPLVVSGSRDRSLRLWGVKIADASTGAPSSFAAGLREGLQTTSVGARAHDVGADAQDAERGAARGGVAGRQTGVDGWDVDLLSETEIWGACIEAWGERVHELAVWSGTDCGREGAGHRQAVTACALANEDYGQDGGPFLVASGGVCRRVRAVLGCGVMRGRGCVCVCWPEAERMYVYQYHPHIHARTRLVPTYMHTYVHACGTGADWDVKVWDVARGSGDHALLRTMGAHGYGQNFAPSPSLFCVSARGIHTRARTHTHTHARTHTHTHTHTHTPKI